ncbi:hypothetical protein [Streptomyces albipurpureus]|uniref:Lipoprotein n=1 Tax=Streptomyces albipurpureus TaxID=2897419 RepID=A0ABT0UUW1_9ACTN|nr:hypothetical protein [Streptomyces sp. CWNU-1]MCM2391148.1 hypothetical protein [Streptomyces sp. CWNU-1]
MRTTTTTTLAALLLVSLTACGTVDGRSTPGTTAPSPGDTRTAKQRFLVDAFSANFEGWTDYAPNEKDLAPFPTAWCKGLSEGRSIESLFDKKGADLYPSGSDWATIKSDANKLLLIAVDTHCPELHNQVTEELSKQSTP